MPKYSGGEGPFQGQSETDLSDLFEDFISAKAQINTDNSDLLCLGDTPEPVARTAKAKSSPLDKINRDLLAAGASLHWLVPFEKRPIAGNWSELPNQTEATLTDSYRQNANIGIRLGEPSKIGSDFLHLVDLDIRDASKAGEAWAELLALWPDARQFPTAVSGSGGESRHIYFLSPVAMRKAKLAHSGGFKMVFDQRLNREVKKYDWEIDLMGTGSQAVIPPSIHPDTKQPYRWQSAPDFTFPFVLIVADAQTRFGAKLSEASEADEDDNSYLERVAASAPLDLPPEDVTEIVSLLPSDWVEDRDHWLTVGAALHHQFEGKREGFDRWCEWAKQSAKFDAKDSARVWKSFKGSTKTPVRMATLIRETGWTKGQSDPLNLEPRKPITPTSFKLGNSHDIAPREWVYGHHLIRKYASATIAQPGIGKSSLTIADAVAIATGKPLVNVKPFDKLRVWIWNGEDPRDELVRRITATCLLYGVTEADLGDRLMVDSGRDLPIKIANADRKGTTISQPDVEKLTAALIENKVDILIVDPFISSHGVPENDNNAMDMVVKLFAKIANDANCAIDLVHHTRKLNGLEADIDSARGASAIAGGVRAGRVLNRMSKDEASKLSVREDERRSYIRIDDAKYNLAPPEKARWVKLVNVWLGNGTADRPEDGVGVVEAWTPPAPSEICTEQLAEIVTAIDGRDYRENAQALEGWVGKVIAPILGLDAEADKAAIKRLVNDLINRGVLKKVKKHIRGAKEEVPIIEVVKCDGFDDRLQSISGGEL